MKLTPFTRVRALLRRCPQAGPVLTALAGPLTQDELGLSLEGWCDQHQLDINDVVVQLRSLLEASR